MVFTPLWRYEIEVEPDALRNVLLYVRQTTPLNDARLRDIHRVIDSTHTAQPIPAISAQAKEAAKIVKSAEGTPDHDPVNHPRHYTFYKGVEIIDLTEQMNFNRGNAVKYISRAGIKDQANEIQDLEKAAWYIGREIERLRTDLADRPHEGPSNAE